MVVHLDHISVKFEYQGNWIKVKVTSVKFIVLTVEYQILLLWPPNDIIMITKVKVIQRQRSFQNQILSVWISIPMHSFGTKVKVISWSRSSQGHSHFKVKVILESNCNVFQFQSRSGRLVFVRMLILLVIIKFSKVHGTPDSTRLGVTSTGHRRQVGAIDILCQITSYG